MNAIEVATNAVLCEIDRLMEADGEDEIRAECNRANAISALSRQVVSQQKMTLDIIMAREAMIQAESVYAAKKMLGNG